MRAGSSDECRFSRLEMTCAAMSSARTPASCPPMLPTAVRTPSRMYASVIVVMSVLLLCAIDGAPKERDHHVVAAPHGHPIEGMPVRGRLLLCDGNQLVARAHGCRIRDGILQRDGDVRPSIAGERHRTVGEREHDAAMRNAESVEHVLANTQLQRAPARARFHELGAEPSRECVEL